ncbi:hypothetical protein HDU97_009021 [Phlyctochytrium planicorne]|nr:hypothetical protein HDU97_009021 [Phlyctochytrium planicorne]
MFGEEGTQVPRQQRDEARRQRADQSDRRKLDERSGLSEALDRSWFSGVPMTPPRDLGNNDNDQGSLQAYHAAEVDGVESGASLTSDFAFCLRLDANPFDLNPCIDDIPAGKMSTSQPSRHSNTTMFGGNAGPSTHPYDSSRKHSQRKISGARKSGDRTTASASVGPSATTREFLHRAIGSPMSAMTYSRTPMTRQPVLPFSGEPSYRTRLSTPPPHNDSPERPFYLHTLSESTVTSTGKRSYMSPDTTEGRVDFLDRSTSPTPSHPKRGRMVPERSPTASSSSFYTRISSSSLSVEPYFIPRRQNSNQRITLASVPRPCGSTVLPTELWDHVLLLLSPRDLATVMRACKNLASLASDPRLWRKVCLEDGVNCRKVARYAKKTGYILPAIDSSNVVKEQSEVESHRFPPPIWKAWEASYLDPFYPPLTEINFTPGMELSGMHHSKPSHLSWMRVWVLQEKLRTAWLRGRQRYRRIANAHAHSVTCIQADPVTGTVVTGGWDGFLRIWRITQRRDVSPYISRSPVRTNRPATKMSVPMTPAKDEDDYLPPLNQSHFGDQWMDDVPNLPVVENEHEENWLQDEAFLDSRWGTSPSPSLRSISGTPSHDPLEYSDLMASNSSGSTGMLWGGGTSVTNGGGMEFDEDGFTIYELADRAQSAGLMGDYPIPPPTPPTYLDEDDEDEAEGRRILSLPSPPRFADEFAGEGRTARKGLAITGNGDIELECVRVINGQGVIECLKLCGDNLVVGGRCHATNNGIVSVYSISKGDKIRSLSTAWPPPQSDPSPYSFYQQPRQPHSSPESVASDVRSISCLDSDGALVVAAWKSTLRVWDLVSGRPIASASRQAGTANVTTISIVKPGELIVDTCALGSVSVWKLDQQIRNRHHHKRIQHTFATDSGVDVESTDNENVSSDGITHLGSLPTVAGVLCSTVDEVEDGGGLDILCGFKDGNLRGWKINDERLTACPEAVPSSNDTLMGEAEATTSTQQTPLLAQSTGTLSSLSDWITCVCSDPLTDIVAAGSWDGRLRVWDRRQRPMGSLEMTDESDEIGGDGHGLPGQGSLRRTLVNPEARSAVLCVTAVGRILISGCYDGGIMVHEFGGSMK